MSNRKVIKQFELDTGVNPAFLEAALTQDISTLDAVLDLIDNSIDAARADSLKASYNGSSKLPDNYSSYEVKIRIDSDSFRIIDNCSGIEEDELTKNTLYTNRYSSHEYGIGRYGIGLKRSLLKIGTDYSLAVDNGKREYKARFDNKGIGGNKENRVVASEYETRGRKKTLFCISNLKDEIKAEFRSGPWFKNAVNEISVRYGAFLKKGLKITLHNAAISSTFTPKGVAPRLRTDCKFKPTRKRMSIDGVEVLIESGIHEDYVFPGEEGHSISSNKRLTDYFGIYFSCNDRIIVSASTEKEYGWNAKWHSEYNGFVCWVRFIAKDPSKLPWNTSKTALRTDSALFLTVKEKLQPIADHYRTEIKRRYSKNDTKTKGKVRKEHSVKSENTLSKERNSASGATPGVEVVATSQIDRQKVQSSASYRKPATRPKETLPRDREVLIDWNTCKTIVPEYRKKEFHIFDELCRLNSADLPITCVTMIRVFLETTVKQVSILSALKWQNLSKNALRVADMLCREGYIEHSDKELITQYATTEGGLFSISNIQSHIHSTRFHPNQPQVNTYWDELDPFLAGCWRFIQDRECSSVLPPNQ